MITLALYLRHNHSLSALEFIIQLPIPNILECTDISLPIVLPKIGISLYVSLFCTFHQEECWATQHSLISIIQMSKLESKKLSDLPRMNKYHGEVFGPRTQTF